MPVKMQCPACQRILKVKDTLAGKTILCPSCQAQCRVPAVAQSEQPALAAVPVAPPKPEPVRSQLGRFQIRAALGQGAFGTVYRAWDPVLNREVALKVPRQSNLSSERLILEARAAAPLRHPNIVAVFEAGADGDDVFIAAEYVEGQTLVDRISETSIEPSLAGEWVKSLAEALDYAHQQGVVHRDVKPHNIMLGADDRAQLMDFGLAVSRSEEPAPNNGNDSGIAGTPAYMSPEQARGNNQETGPASDQYSLGAVLYELLTGSPPFRGGSEIVKQIAAEAKPTAPRSVVPSIPRDVEAICLKAMATQPAERYVNCRAFSEDLGRFLNGELVRARWYSPWELALYWARKRPALFGWTTAAVCLLALLIGGSAAIGMRTLMADPPEAPAVVTDNSPVVSEPLPESSTTTEVDVISELDAETLLYGRQLDRTRMAFEQDDVIQADRVLEESRWDFRNWEYNYLRRIVNGGWKTLHGHWSEITAITIHPDGRHFASAGYDNKIRIWDIATGEPRHVLNCNRLVTSLAYSPDGSLLAVATGDSSERPTRPEYGISQAAMMAGPVMMATPAPVAPGSSVPAPVPTPGPASGPTVAMPGFAQPGPNEHAVILLDSQTLQQVAIYSEHSGPIASITFSSDGQRIASGGSDKNPAGPAPTGHGNASRAGSVRIWNVKTLKTERELASPSGPIRRLAFIPGSQRIAATTGERSFGSVLIWNLDPNAPPADMPGPPAPMPPHQPALPAAASAVSADVVIPVALRRAPDESRSQPDASPLPTPRPTVNEIVPQPPISGALTESGTPNSGPLMPEQQFSAGSLALAVSGANGGKIVAAPAMDLWLLEQARRRISGTRGVVREWMMTGGPESTDVHGSPSAVFDMAFAGEPNSHGSPSLAVAGGDPLQIHRPGLLTLHNSSYEYGTPVKHRGHRSAITAVTFRGDGKQFITGDADGTLKIWSAEVHPEVVRMPGSAVATRVAFGNDGRYVAVANRNESWTTVRGAVSMWDAQGNPIPPDNSAPGTIRLQDIRNGNTLLTLTGGPGDILGLAMDPQSRWIAGGGEDAHVHVWNTDSGRIRYERETPGVVRCVAVSRDGQMIAASCNAASRGIQPVPEGAAPMPNPGDSRQGFVVVWQVSDGKEVARWPAHEGDALSVAFSPDGLQLATSGSDRSVKVWTLSDRKLAFSAESYEGEIVDLAFRPSGGDLAGVGFDSCRPDKAGDVIVWNVADGRRRLTLPGISGRMYGVAYTPDGRRFATGGGAYEGSLATPGDVKVRDAETGIELLPLIGRPGRSEKKETVCVTVCVPTTKMVTETVTRTVEEQVPEQKTRTTKVPVKTIGDDGKEVTTYEERAETITEIRTVRKEVPVTVCRPVSVPEIRTENRSNDVTWEEPGTVLGIAFSGDGRSLAAACEDGSALVWDAANCQPHDTLTWTDGRMLCSGASPDGRLIATGGDKGSGCECKGLIRLFDAMTGRMTREIETAAGAVTEIAFLPGSKNVVIVAGCNSWQLGSSCSMVGDHVPMSQKLANQFSVIRNTIDVRSRCEVWDMEAGTRVIEVGEPAESISQIAVHPIDGRVLIATDKVIRLHDSTSGKELRRWTINSHAVSLVVTPNGNRFAVCTGDGTVLMGNPNSDQPPMLVAEKLSNSLLTFDSGGTQLAAVERMGNGSGAPQLVSVSKEQAGPSVKPEVVSRRQLHLWNVDSPETHRVMPLTSSHTPSGIAWHSAMKSSVIGGEDGSVVVVDPSDGSQSLRMTGHKDATRVLTLPDGRFASIGTENKLKVWRTEPLIHPIPDCSECTVPRGRTVTLPTDPRASVIKVQFSGDGQLAAVSGNRPVQNSPTGSQHPVRLVDAGTGNDRLAGGHMDTVRSVAVRPGGQQIATVSQDMKLRIWSSEGQLLHERPHSNKLMQVVYSPDGSMIATATAFDGLVWLWNAETLEEIRKFQVEPMTAFALAFDHQSQQLVTAGISGAIKVWNAQTGELVREWTGHEGKIETVVFSSDGATLASCGDDKTAKLWQFDSGELVRTIDGYQTPLWDIAFSPDDSLLAVGALEPTVRIFKVETGELVKELPDHGEGVWSLAFSPDGTRLACCGRQTPLVVWNWADATRIAGNPKAGECLAWGPGPDGSQLVTGNVVMPPQEQRWESVISLHHSLSGDVIDTIIIPNVTPRDFALSHDGRYLAGYRQDGVALIWDREQDKVIAECRGHQGAILDIAFHPDGERIATAGQDGFVRIWKLDGTEESAIPQSGQASCLTFSPDGQLLAVGVDRVVTVWDFVRREARHKLGGHYGGLCDLSFSGDQTFLATTSRTYSNDRWVGDLKVWETATGKRTLSVHSHTSWNAAVAFHPQLPLIASTGKDHSVMLFHAATGRLMLSVPTSGYLCESLAFSPDGARLLAPLGNRAKLIDPTPMSEEFGSAPPAQTVQDPAEEAAARWILEHGGQVQVIIDDVAPFDISQPADLPSDPFVVRRISLTGNESLRDSDVSILHPLRHLVAVRLDLKNLTIDGVRFLGNNKGLQELYLNGTQLTDKGLAGFRDLLQLRILHINDTAVTGSGVMLSLQGCALLENIEMHRTAVDDLTLMSVIKLRGLKSLGLSGTKVTDQGIAAAQKIKPELSFGR